MKRVKVFTATALTVLTLSHSRPTHAALGAFAGGYPIAIAGIVVIGAGVGGGAYFAAKIIKTCSGLACLKAIIPVVGGAGVAFGGLMILEGEQAVQFIALNPEDASRLKISGEAVAIYNSEVDQVNLLMAEVNETLSKIKSPSAENSADAWNELKEYISPETFSVMQKIVSQK